MFADMINLMINLMINFLNFLRLILLLLIIQRHETGHAQECRDIDFRTGQWVLDKNESCGLKSNYVGHANLQDIKKIIKAFYYVSVMISIGETWSYLIIISLYAAV